MSTSILYHAFGIKGIHYESTSYEGDAFVISARLTDQHVKCLECGHRKAAFKGHKRGKILFLETWCKDARESGIKVLARVGKTLSGCRTGLLNYFKHRISNAMTEGLNNKIKTLKRQAYGFRDMEYFIPRLCHLHTQRYSLTG